MKTVQTVVRQLLVIAPAMVSTKTVHGCELTWPFDPASEPWFIEIGVRGQQYIKEGDFRVDKRGYPVEYWKMIWRG
jgi:hypothetical protein